MRKHLNATTEGIHAYIDGLMRMMDQQIREHQGKATATNSVIANCLEEIDACNKLLVGQDVVHVVTADNAQKMRELRPLDFKGGK